MPVRATKRGAERTPLSGHHDVLICGASFAGLAVARELEGLGADVLLLDRYEVGERQTSACAAPTPWLEALDLQSAIRQTFDDLVIHRPDRTRSRRWRLPWSFSTFDYREVCRLLREQGSSARFETAKVEGRTGHTVHTDRGDLSAELVVDALGWRRVLSSAAEPIQPPEARLSRGLEVHPPSAGDALELWLDPKYVPDGYAWAFPADDEVRIGVGSFDPHRKVKDETVQITRDLGLEPNEYQGNWIPHQLREATEDAIFFTGDSAGHCLPTTAEGIRTALHFGMACGRELRAVLEQAKTREQALSDYAAFSDRHRRAFDWLLRVQGGVGPTNPTRVMDAMVAFCSRPRVSNWLFERYLAIAPPPPAVAAQEGRSARIETPSDSAHAPASCSTSSASTAPA